MSGRNILEDIGLKTMFHLGYTERIRSAKSFLNAFLIAGIERTGFVG